MTGPAAQQVLILGAGLVTRPIVRYFLKRPRTELTVATLYEEDAAKLVAGHTNGTAQALDVSQPAELDALIRGRDLVVSLVPYQFHASVAEAAIRHRVNMVTTSYVSPEMRQLNDQARDANVMVLNEIGLDPGLDHMSAIRLIDDVRRSGGQVVEFISCCGGLPAPEAADNPWRYKFSWSPRGALMASRLSARFMRLGRVRFVPGPQLFSCRWPYPIEEVEGVNEVEGAGGAGEAGIAGIEVFEMYPNRDSMRYIERYSLQGVRTMLRGTLRYPGWCDTMRSLAQLRILDLEPRPWPAGTTYADFLAAFLPPGSGTLRRRLAERLARAEDDAVIQRLEWAGLLSGDAIPEGELSPLDVLAHRFQQRMAYAANERDMVVQHHQLLARWPDAPDRSAEIRDSLLISFGEPGGDTATSRTVSLPAALAGDLILSGKLHLPGVHIPNRLDIAEPVLDALETRGIVFRERSRPADAGTELLPPREPNTAC